MEPPHQTGLAEVAWASWWGPGPEADPRHMVRGSSPRCHQPASSPSVRPGEHVGVSLRPRRGISAGFGSRVRSIGSRFVFAGCPPVRPQGSHGTAHGWANDPTRSMNRPPRPNKWPAGGQRRLQSACWCAGPPAGPRPVGHAQEAEGEPQGGQRAEVGAGGEEQQRPHGGPEPAGEEVVGGGGPRRGLHLGDGGTSGGQAEGAGSAITSVTRRHRGSAWNNFELSERIPAKKIQPLCPLERAKRRIQMKHKKYNENRRTPATPRTRTRGSCRPCAADRNGGSP